MKFISLLISFIMILASAISPKTDASVQKANTLARGESAATVYAGAAVYAEVSAPSEAVNCVVLSEPEGKITAFSVYGVTGGRETLLTKGDTVGEYRLCTFEKSCCDKIKITVDSSSGDSELTVIPSVINTEKRDFRVSSYYVCRSDNMTLAACPDNGIAVSTDLILFGLAEFDENGYITLANRKKLLPFIFELRRANPDLNITINILSKGVDGDDWDTQIANRNALCKGAMYNNKDKFIDNIVTLVNDYGFDGVHFDWEYPTTVAAKAVFSQFAVSLKEALGEKKLGTALTEWCCNFSKDAINAFDYVEVMAYDAFDANRYHSTFNSAVYSVSEFIKAGYPKEKLNLGLPFYGRELSGDASWPLYSTYAEVLGKYGFVTNTAEAGDSYFNNVAIIADKTAYAYNIGLGGVMVWHMSCDSDIPELSLYNAIKGATD